MSLKALIPVVLALAPAALAHMELINPPPFRSKYNPHTVGEPDTQLQYPFGCCGKTTPALCKGYLNLLGTPEGASVATWQAGSKQTWTIGGLGELGGNHYGGSCQIGFSVDKGKTFQVATSYEGNCPHRNAGNGPDGQDFDFTVPADMPNGEAVFAWSWVNREQEFNMNCAVVTIDGGSGSAANTTGEKGSGGTGSGASTAPSASTPTKSASRGSKGRGGSKSTASPSISTASSSASTSYSMDGCTCACPSSPTQNSGSYQLSSCTCTCASKPAAASEGSSNTNNEEEKRDALSLLFRRHRSSTLEQRNALSEARKDKRAVAYAARPTMLMADVGNGCSSPKTDAELRYPDPGPEVVQGDGEYPTELPSGNCG